MHKETNFLQYYLLLKRKVSDDGCDGGSDVRIVRQSNHRVVGREGDQGRGQHAQIQLKCSSECVYVVGGERSRTLVGIEQSAQSIDLGL